MTSLAWISHYGCYYVAHGDDITSDSSGEDCYRHVKKAGRFRVFKRTPNISTTDLVGRMLLCTRSHFIKSLAAVLDGEEGPGSESERKALGESMKTRIKGYATDKTGLSPGAEVWTWTTSESTAVDKSSEDSGKSVKMVAGQGPKPGQRIVYVDGGFDLFSSGHIEFLRQVTMVELQVGNEKSWFTEEAKARRMHEHGRDFPPFFLIAGIHDDDVINHWKGVNYPIMNIFERGLCVLQCKVRPSLQFDICSAE